MNEMEYEHEARNNERSALRSWKLLRTAEGCVRIGFKKIIRPFSRENARRRRAGNPVPCVHFKKITY